MTVQITFLFGRNALRTADQIGAVAEREHIRALPHISRGIQAAQFTARDLAEILPLPQVGRTQQQHPALQLRILRGQHHVPAVVVTPHFRIADMAGVALRHGDDRAKLVKTARTVLLRQALPRRARAIIEFYVAGVDQCQYAVIIDRAAGVAATAVILLIRHQRDGLMLPVQQIG